MTDLFKKMIFRKYALPNHLPNHLPNYRRIRLQKACLHKICKRSLRHPNFGKMTLHEVENIEKLNDIQLKKVVESMKQSDIDAYHNEHSESADIIPEIFEESTPENDNIQKIDEILKDVFSDSLNDMSHLY